jgi:hypothetical protein
MAKTTITASLPGHHYMLGEFVTLTSSRTVPRTRPQRVVDWLLRRKPRNIRLLTRVVEASDTFVVFEVLEEIQ